VIFPPCRGKAARRPVPYAGRRAWWRALGRLRIAALVLLAASLALLGERAWLSGKALVADRLIARAYARHLADGEPHPPWSWADHHPVALLAVPRLGLRRHVLRGGTGATLAFGVGHVDGSAAPGEAGHCVLAGHRDMAFRFLRELAPGDALHLESRGGVYRYEVVQCFVVSREETWVLAPDLGDRLTLITCYPFDAFLGGPLRYVVVAEPHGDS